jgi:hypothetical protein
LPIKILPSKKEFNIEKKIKTSIENIVEYSILVDISDILNDLLFLKTYKLNNTIIKKKKGHLIDKKL